MKKTSEEERQEAIEYLKPEKIRTRNRVALIAILFSFSAICLICFFSISISIPGAFSIKIPQLTNTGYAIAKGCLAILAFIAVRSLKSK